ncbi:MAG: hypothetical protein AB7O24_19125 [Kofleriaceae bacterium]
MVRIALAAVVVVAACQPAQVPLARRAGQVMAIGGVAGLVGTAIATRYTDVPDEMLYGFSAISAIGIIAYAIVELTYPVAGPPPETQAQKYRRWAKVLTERAAGAAREGKCPRVRRLERRVRTYDPEVHDFVFMRDPEIRRCLEMAPSPPSPDAGARPQSDQTPVIEPSVTAPLVLPPSP